MSLTAKYTASVTLTGLASGALAIEPATPVLQVQLAPFYQGDPGVPGGVTSVGDGFELVGTEIRLSIEALPGG